MKSVLLLSLCLSFLTVGCLTDIFGTEESEDKFVPPTIDLAAILTPTPEVEGSGETSDTVIQEVPTPTMIPIPQPEETIPPPTPTPVPPPPPTITPTPAPENPPIVLVPPVIPTTPSPVVPNSSVVQPVPVVVIPPTPKYAIVSSEQVTGIPDKLDFTAGPTVSGNTVSFAATYVQRGSGTPTVVQLWQRNGLSEAVASDALDDECSTQGPVVFFRKAPDRGMKYTQFEVTNYPWTYCLNQYAYAQTTTVPWVNSTTWDYNIDGVLETFTFSAEKPNGLHRFDTVGAWVLVIFAGDSILSETVVQ